jgi:hypothetical protein
MKKNLLTGLIAIGLITAGGTGFAMAKAQQKTQDPVYFMQEHGMGQGQMTQMMNTSNKGSKQQNKNSAVTFEQMLPYMKKMHPDLSDEQLKALFEQMHGQNGGCSNAAGATEQGMRGTSNTNL